MVRRPALDTERHPPYGVIDIRCECCQLAQRLRDRGGPFPTVCDVCYQHRGKLPEARLARAESHEEMLRKHLAACRASEHRARNARDGALEQVADALRSRGALADRLVEAAGACRRHDCPAWLLGHDPKIIEIAAGHRERQSGRRPAPWHLAP